jgi:hypothetical protein
MKLAAFILGAALAPSLLRPAAAIEVAAIYEGFPGYAGCKERADMQRVIELAEQYDLEAAREIIRRGIKSKDCRVLGGDIIVELVPPFSRLAKVHMRGDPDAYWIIQ